MYGEREGVEEKCAEADRKTYISFLRTIENFKGLFDGSTKVMLSMIDFFSNLAEKRGVSFDDTIALFVVNIEYIYRIFGFKKPEGAANIWAELYNRVSIPEN